MGIYNKLKEAITDVSGFLQIFLKNFTHLLAIVVFLSIFVWGLDKASFYVAATMSLNAGLIYSVLTVIVIAAIATALNDYKQD